MKLSTPSFEVLTNIDGIDILKRIEAAGRTCYRSEDKITKNSCIAFVRGIMKIGHLSVIEHESLSVRFIIDRACGYELVRHRLCSFSQESTRYCNYSGGVEFIIPPWCDDIACGEYTEQSNLDTLNVSDSSLVWLESMYEAEQSYISLLNKGWTPQQARSVLPNSLKTEIVCTANLREWRHILELRTGKAAHPQIREVMIPLLEELQGQISIIFDDINC
jgi:thymidylate synthase (FAD)